MTILQLIASDGFITVNKALIKLMGLEESILLGELASEFDYWTKNNGLTEDGFFFSTIENIEDKTTLSEYQQRKALKHLQEMGLVEIRVKGLPAKRYIKLFVQKIIDLIQNYNLNNLKTSSEKTTELDTEKLQGNNNIDNNNIDNNRPISKEIAQSADSDNSFDFSSKKKYLRPTLDNKDTTYFSEEGNSVVTNAVTPPAKKQSRKDQLTDYINSLDFSEETKDQLFKWLFNIGLKGGITVNQLKDKLQKVANDCANDEKLIRQSIEEAYLNKWFGFFKSNKTISTNNCGYKSKVVTNNNNITYEELVKVQQEAARQGGEPQAQRVQLCNDYVF